MSLIQTIIRTRFSLTSRTAADRLIEVERDLTTAVCHRLGGEGCEQAVTVPSLLGVDDDMKDWSVYQALEHNSIVNRRITSQILFATGNGPEPDPDFDVKHDVMPSVDPGPEQLAEFEQSIADHFQKIAPLKTLRKTKEAMHPIFGSFDAHKWHCMFGFHLQIHRRQIEAIEKILLADSK